MAPKRQLSRIFIGLYILLWLLGPVTQLIQIVNLPLHVKMGISEARILDPEFGWFRADELAIAWADMTYLVAGVIFIVGVFLRRSWSLPFGFFSLSAWAFILLVALIRWPLLEASGFGVIAQGQKIVYNAYAVIYITFGLFGIFYLWRNRYVYDSNPGRTGAR
jgi:hypothetical protein